MFAVHGRRVRVAAHVRRGVLGKDILLLSKWGHCWVDVTLGSVRLTGLALLVETNDVERGLVDVMVWM